MGKTSSNLVEGEKRSEKGTELQDLYRGVKNNNDEKKTFGC